jgi:hypothetical protein
LQCCIFGIFLFTSMCIGVFNVGSHSQQRSKFIQPKIEEQVSWYDEMNPTLRCVNWINISNYSHVSLGVGGHRFYLRLVWHLQSSSWTIFQGKILSHRLEVTFLDIMIWYKLRHYGPCFWFFLLWFFTILTLNQDILLWSL